MKILETPMSGLHLMESAVFGDERGWFTESHNTKTFSGLGIHATFVQDNHSRSRRGILRGLHYQIHQPQDKLVRCIVGRIYDVAVDIRRSSATFGRWFGAELSADNKRQLYVPKGFAHGFLVLSEAAEVIYKVTDYWSKDAERGLRWNDPALNIAWPAEGLPPQLAARDAGFPGLREVAEGDLFP